MIITKEEEEEEEKKNRRKMEDKGLKINNNRVTRESHTLFSNRKSLANLLSTQLKLNHYTLLLPLDCATGLEGFTTLHDDIKPFTS
jgi:hypothetical protein